MSQASYFLTVTTLAQENVSHQLPSIIKSTDDASDEQLDLMEASIAASLHCGDATQDYDRPAFERICGVLLYPEPDMRQQISESVANTLSKTIPVYEDMSAFSADNVEQARIFLSMS